MAKCFSQDWRPLYKECFYKKENKNKKKYGILNNDEQRNKQFGDGFK